MSLLIGNAARLPCHPCTLRYQLGRGERGSGAASIRPSPIPRSDFHRLPQYPAYSSGMRMRVVVGSLLVVALAGCSRGSAPERPCTAMGSEHGLAITVASDVAPVHDLVLDVCVEGQCQEGHVVLRPGRSGSSESDGTQVGHVLAELRAGPVAVNGRYRDGGRMIDVATTTVEARTAYPNGPGCGADGTQAHVTLDSGGLH